MNTRFVIVIPGISTDKGDNLAQSIQNIVRQWEQRLSRFNSNSELSKLNNSAYEDEIAVSPVMAQILNTCDKYVQLTGGLFDPGFAPVYDMLRKNENIAVRLLNDLRNNCGWKQVHWNKSVQKVSFHTGDIKLDFGGIGKGIALKETVSYLKTNGIESAFLSFGESSVAGIGSHPYGDGWPVGFGKSQGNKGQEPVVLLRDEYISVSGMQNERESHIYNPYLSRLVNKNNEVMVKNNCPVEAEVLSTAGYLADKTQIERLKHQFPDVGWYWRDK